MSDPQEFAQLSFAFVDEVQRRYEVIRPLVLLKNTTADQRSIQTGVDRRVIQRYVDKFDSGGMLGLLPKRTENRGYPQVPAQVQDRVLVLKELYPPLSGREIARSVQHALGYSLDHKRVKRSLGRISLPEEYQRPELFNITTMKILTRHG